MKHFFLIVFLLGCQIASSQTTLDPKMFGSWKGSEKGQQFEGVERHWIQHRFEDGTYIILFTILEDGEVTTSSEKGKWWIENGEFHEMTSGSRIPDVYTYKFIDDDHVKFRAKTPRADFNNENYEFIDVRILEDNL